MTRVVVALSLALATVVGLVVLSDATTYRGGTASPDHQTTVTFGIEIRRYRHGDTAAASLWFSCVGSVGVAEAGPPALNRDGTYTASLRPSLNEDSRRRFRGCLEDATVARVIGSVEAMVNEPVRDAAASPGGRDPGGDRATRTRPDR